MECAVLYGHSGCISLSIPSGGIKSTIKGGKSCYVNGFVHINGVYYASCNEKAIINVINNGEIRTISLPELCPVLKSISNSILVAGSISGKVYFWNIINGCLIKVLKPHSKSITCIDFDSSYNTILTGSMDSSMKLISQPLLDSEDISIFYGHLSPIINCLNLIDNKYKFNIASISEDSTLKLWKLQANKQVAQCIYSIDLESRPNYMIKGLGNYLYITLSNSKIMRLDLVDLSQKPKLYNFVTCIKILESCEGYHLISLSVDGLRIWDSEAMTCLSHHHIGGDCNSMLLCRPMDGRFIISSLKFIESQECHFTILQSDKESVRRRVKDSQNKLLKLLPENPMLDTLDLDMHLKLFKESEQLYKLVELQVIETSKQMKSIDEFNKLYNNIN